MDITHIGRQRMHIPANPRKGLTEGKLIPRCREHRIVEMANGNIISDGRNKIFAFRLLDTDRSKSGKIINLFIHKAVENITANKFLDGEARPQNETGAFKIITAFILIIPNRSENIKPGRQIPPKEVRFCETNINGLGFRPDGDSKP